MRDIRLTALLRFAAAITVLNILGHAVLGFEEAVLIPIVALMTAYALELGLEFSSVGRRPFRFNGGLRRFVDFLLPAHITGLAEHAAVRERPDRPRGLGRDHDAAEPSAPLRALLSATGPDQARRRPPQKEWP